ncbi:hypothetical protein OH460_08820 [Vibrio sp. Makdt]|uniref:hypothetical protein n=1 Tax=Vibrio sp. Makdt TaxID=2998828 RepID=UPI0022CD4257|nr:hypothetical protein [Vibrio sp. Makdt]MDA0152403.1 hypothetical protein [Vibrio sp. Makdt]
MDIHTTPDAAEFLLGTKSSKSTLVHIEAMTKDERELASVISNFKACFDNCFSFIELTSATYVLGYVNVGIPVEHAWIKVGDRYIDPTYETFGIKVDEYYSVLEVPITKMFNLVTGIAQHSNDVPRAPMLHGLSKHPDFQYLFVDRSTRMNSFIFSVSQDARL